MKKGTRKTSFQRAKMLFILDRGVYVAFPHLHMRFDSPQKLTDMFLFVDFVHQVWCIYHCNLVAKKVLSILEASAP